LKISLFTDESDFFLKQLSAHTNCIFCDSSSLEELVNYNSVGLSQCQDCDFIFSKWIPSNEELIEYYSKGYELTNYFSPITEKRYNQLLDQFEKFRLTNRILDIGAGCGFFLEIAKKRGWEVYGTELSERVIHNCNNKIENMSYGTLESINYPENHFDIIVNFEVIEHINAPQQFVSEMYRILRKGGINYLTTPNFNAIHRYRLKEKYDVISYPNHLCYFTKKTLKQVFKSNGFTPIKIVTTGYSLTRLKTSKGISNQSFVSETSDDEMLRYKIESNVFLKFSKWLFNGVLNLFKVGDSLKGTFIKK